MSLYLHRLDNSWAIHEGPETCGANGKRGDFLQGQDLRPGERGKKTSVEGLASRLQLRREMGAVCVWSRVGGPRRAGCGAQAGLQGV